MTEDELNSIEARANAATPGPWGFGAGWMNGLVTDTGIAICRFTKLRESERDKPNATFISHAREDVPKLIAEIRRLRNSYILERKPKLKLNTNKTCLCCRKSHDTIDTTEANGVRLCNWCHSFDALERDSKRD